MYWVCVVVLLTSFILVNGWTLDRLKTHSYGTAILASKTPESVNSPFRRKLQVRKAKGVKRPSGYWKDIANVDTELRLAWRSANVTVNQSEPPPIPNESILNYWKRYDLRSAIVTHGGREVLAERLGGAVVIPGKWSLAVETSWIKELLQHDPNLSSDVPPRSPQQLKRDGGKKDSTQNSSGEETNRWVHQSTRKVKGYWTDEVLIQELYEYLDKRRDKDGIPAVWMPRSSELNNVGRNDLSQAIQRFGGNKRICQQAGLIPFREWKYMEGMFDLLVELRLYLDEFHDGDYSFFPKVSTLPPKYSRLKSLVQYFGGRKFVASRFGMKSSTAKSKKQLDLEWGKFDLEFAIDLLDFVRKEEMKKKPPLTYDFIPMPSQRKLLLAGEKGRLLDEKINDYGGYENVARRLGLGYQF